MKRMKRLFCGLLAVLVLAMGLTACGEAGGGDVAEVNTATGTYDEMVSYLTAKGYIAEDATPVDINTTEGYLIDNTGGEWTDLAVADKAGDYDGLWLFWWDPDAENEYDEVFDFIAVNGNVILLGGGAAMIQLEGFSGNFGIAFGEDYAQKDAVLEDFGALPKE